MARDQRSVSCRGENVAIVAADMRDVDAVRGHPATSQLLDLTSRSACWSSECCSLPARPTARRAEPSLPTPSHTTGSMIALSALTDEHSDSSLLAERDRPEAGKPIYQDLTDKARPLGYGPSRGCPDRDSCPFRRASAQAASTVPVGNRRMCILIAPDS